MEGFSSRPCCLRSAGSGVGRVRVEQRPRYPAESPRLPWPPAPSAPRSPGRGGGFFAGKAPGRLHPGAPSRGEPSEHLSPLAALGRARTSRSAPFVRRALGFPFAIPALQWGCRRNEISDTKRRFFGCFSCMFRACVGSEIPTFIR